MHTTCVEVHVELLLGTISRKVASRNSTYFVMERVHPSGACANTLLKCSSPDVMPVTLETYVQAGRYVKIKEYIPEKKSETFTSREREVISLIDEGLTNQEIAGRLSLSLYTIKNHRKSLFRKMNVRNRVELLNRVRALV